MKPLKQKNKIQATIFDMDGVLIDSMLHWITEDRAFLRSLDIDLTKEMIIRFTGRSEKENLKWLIETYGLKKSLEELMITRNSFTERIYARKSHVMPGFAELLKKITKFGFKKAIASGSSLRRVEMIVERFNWHDYFDELVSSDHVDCIGKPDPRIYLHTAERLQVAPKKCVVFEDAENGVVAAKKAGMLCIAIPDKRWSFGDFSQADLIVDSLNDERIYKFLDL